MSRLKVLALMGLPLVAGACGRIGYGRLGAGLDGGPSGAGGSTTSGAGGATTSGAGGATTSGAGGSTTSGAGGAGSGGSGQGGSVDASQPDADFGDLTPPNDSSAPPASCTQAGTPTMTWSFGTDIQGWELSGTGTMVWTAAVGDPVAGALQVDWGGGVTTHPRLVQALGDLRGRIVTAEIWLESGTSATVKLFVQAGMRQVWADGGLVALTPGQWTCLALDLDNPVFSRQQFNPSDVQIIGVELDAMGPSRVYLDQFAY